MVFSQTEWLDNHQLQWETVHIAGYLTQRKLNTQQAIAYPSEKQDKIPKNKPKEKQVVNLNKVRK